MRVLNSNYLRVFLIVFLILSFSLSSVFAASTLSIRYSEPATSDNQGYLVVKCTDDSYYIYFWSMTNYTNGYPCSVSLDYNSSYVNMTFASNGGFRMSMSYISGLSGTIGSYWSRVVTSSEGAWTGTLNFASVGQTIEAVTYSGNIGTVSGSTEVLNVIWGNDSIASSINSNILKVLAELQSQGDSIDSINSYIKTFSTSLNNILTELKDLGLSLDSVLDILNDWADTSLSESTTPLPDSNINDFDNSSGSLRNDNDVSANLDSVINSVNFGSFSNGFTVIWDMVTSVFNSNPIFFVLLTLVLSLGLLNLIFNRR